MLEGRGDIAPAVGRGRDPASIGWGLPEHLGSWSTELKAVAAAFYETGYALSPGELTSSAANWTGLVYLVAGWPGHDPGCSEAGQTNTDGFRPTINASDGELALIVDGDTAVPECLEGADLAALSAAVPYARGASCALVVGSGSTGFFRSIVIFYFRTKEDAARARLRLLNGEGGSRIEHLRDAMSDEAARDWFDILAGFWLRCTTPLCSEKKFAGLVAEAIGQLAYRIRCPDIRIYLLANPAIITSQAPTAISSDPGPRFRLVAASRMSRQAPSLRMTRRPFRGCSSTAGVWHCITLQASPRVGWMVSSYTKGLNQLSMLASMWMMCRSRSTPLMGAQPVHQS